jgi:hypothetical protein
MKHYSEDEIRDMVKEQLNKDSHLFYKSAFLNYSGNTKDTQKTYTEVIADELAINYDRISQPLSIPIRKKSFNSDHNGIANVKSRLQKFGGLKYCEKLLAIALYNSGQMYCLGKILDYEVPLKEKQKPYNLGKIDLVSVDDITQSVKLIELKIKKVRGTDETLLRAVLEIYTYCKLIMNSKSQDKFVKDFELPKHYQLQPAILTDEKALSGITLLNIKEYPRLQALINAMNNELGKQIEGFVYDYPDRSNPFQDFAQGAQDQNRKITLQGVVMIRKII